jgi:hypothetical protein
MALTCCESGVRQLSYACGALFDTIGMSFKWGDSFGKVGEWRW